MQQFFGAGSGPTPADPYRSTGSTPVPAGPYSGGGGLLPPGTRPNVNPGGAGGGFGMDIASILGGGEPFETTTALPPRREIVPTGLDTLDGVLEQYAKWAPTMPDALPPLDQSAIRELMAKGAPDPTSVMGEDDKLGYILSGLAGSGAGQAENVGELLMSLGLGGIGGLGKFTKAQRGEEQDFADSLREHNIQSALLEQNLTATERAELRANQALQSEFMTRTREHQERQMEIELEIIGANRDYEQALADAQHAWDTAVFDATQTKIVGTGRNQYIQRGTLDEAGENITSSLQRMPDQRLAAGLALGAAGQNELNVATAIYGGAQIPGVEARDLARLRTLLQEEIFAISESPEFQDMMISATTTGTKIDSLPLIMNMVDQKLQAQDPELWEKARQHFLGQAVLQGVGGGSWRY